MSEWSTLESIGCRLLGPLVAIRADNPDEIIGDEGGFQIHASGAYLPTGSLEEAVTGIVIGIGPGIFLTEGLNAGQTIPLDVQIGDHVSHSKYGIKKQEVAGEWIRLLHIKDIFMKLPVAAENPET